MAKIIKIKAVNINLSIYYRVSFMNINLLVARFLKDSCGKLAVNEDILAAKTVIITFRVKAPKRSNS